VDLLERGGSGQEVVAAPQDARQKPATRWPDITPTSVDREANLSKRSAADVCQAVSMSLAAVIYRDYYLLTILENSRDDGYADKDLV